jgi:hypothetical protein
MDFQPVLEARLAEKAVSFGVPFFVTIHDNDVVLSSHFVACFHAYLIFFRRKTLALVLGGPPRYILYAVLQECQRPLPWPCARRTTVYTIVFWECRCRRRVLVTRRLRFG